MSNYTSGNNAPTLMKQAPNRKGNHDLTSPSHDTGVTAVTNKNGSTMYPPGCQGAPKVGPHGGKTAGVTAGRKQPVMMSRPKELYDGKIKNDGYIAKDGKSWLK